MLRLDRLLYFLSVVDAGSFTQPAQQAVTKAVVSAQAARLEEELEASLFMRTTRSVTLKEDGELLLAHARQSVSKADSAQEALQSRRATGFLRITAPLDHGQSFLVLVLARFRALYPACIASLDLSDSVVNMQSGKWDLSIRLGWLVDPRLKSQRVGKIGQYLVATPELARQFEPLNDTQDLDTWPFVANTVLREPYRHEFERGDGLRVWVRLEVVAGMTTTPAVLAGALAGLGAAILPDFLVMEPLKDGRLIR